MECLNDALTKVVESLDIWKTEEGDPYVTIKGTSKPMSPDSASFRMYVRDVYRDMNKTLILSKELSEIVDSIKDIANCQGEIRKTCMRVGEKDGALYYDALGHFVKFQGGKWEILEECDLSFLCPAGMLGQVKPDEQGIKLPQLLEKYVPTKNQKDLALIISWLIACFKPGGPYPVLILKGEQGSAKSTTTRVLCNLVDPNSRDMRAPPSDLRDLVTFVKNGFVIAFDNVSKITEKQSDDYCRLATGHGALGGRKLFSNHDDVSFKAVRPLILNGIADFVVRPDLLDRSITVELPAIPQAKRMDDDTFWENFNKDKPLILAALYNAVAMAYFKEKSVVIPEENRIRMSNFCRWAMAASEALDFPEGFVIESLYKAWNETAMVAMDSDPVAIAIMNYFQKEKLFQGDMTKFMNAMSQHKSTGDDVWPQTPRGMSSSLQRLLPTLRKSGIIYTPTGRDSRTKRTLFELSLDPTSRIEACAGGELA